MKQPPEVLERSFVNKHYHYCVFFFLISFLYLTIYIQGFFVLCLKIQNDFNNVNYDLSQTHKKSGIVSKVTLYFKVSLLQCKYIFKY